MPGVMASLSHLSATPHSVSTWSGFESTPLIGFGGAQGTINQPLKDALASYDDLDQSILSCRSARPTWNSPAKLRMSCGDQDFWEEARLLRHATPISGTGLIFYALEHILGILLITPTGGPTTVIEPTHRPPHWAQTSSRAALEPLPPLQPRASMALKAIADIQEWLTVSRDVVSGAAGLAKRTIAYWQSGETEPHASSTRRLMELHGLVGSVVRRLGEDRGRAWFLEQDDSGETRLDQLNAADGILRLSRAARTVLFAKPELPRHPSDLDDEVPDFEFDPTSAQTPPNRPRRII